MQSRHCQHSLSAALLQRIHLAMQQHMGTPILSTAEGWKCIRALQRAALH
jgi:hypothetical protein